VPHVPTDPNRKTWKYGVTVIGKVAAPGSKPVVKGTGRTSLQFTVRIQPALALFKETKDFKYLNFRCMWLDPDFLLETNDVVEVTGNISRTGAPSDLGMVVNQCTLLARFVSVRRGKSKAS
jgi:hypothetical protein